MNLSQVHTDAVFWHLKECIFSDIWILMAANVVALVFSID